MKALPSAPQTAAGAEATLLASANIATKSAFRIRCVPHKRSLVERIQSRQATFKMPIAPVIRITLDGERELTVMHWGFPPPVATSRPVTNVRNLASPFLAHRAQPPGPAMPDPRHLLL